MRSASKDTEKLAPTGGTASSFKKRMKSLQEAWDAARKRESFGPSVEDGIYEARLVSAIMAESRAGRDQIAWTYVITEGEEKGTQIRDYDGLATEDNFFFVQQKLARLEAEIPTKAEEISDALEALTKATPLVRLRVSTKDGFTHAYVDRLLEDNGKGEDDEDKDKKPETGEGENEGSDLVVGAKVQFPSPKTGKPLLGEVLEIDEDEETVKIKSDKGKEYTIDISDLALVEGEDDDE